MLYYSRKSLISLQNCWKPLRCSQEQSAIQSRLRTCGLLRRLRGGRGGKAKFSRLVRPISVVTGRPRTKPNWVSGVHSKNLLNIQLENYANIDAQSTEEHTVGIDAHSAGEMIVANDITEKTFAYNNTQDINTVRTNKKILNDTQTRKQQKPKVRIRHLNVRSLKNRDHLVQLRSLVQENKLDILAVSESWLNSSVKNAQVEIQGYKISRLDREKKISGGVCIIIHTCLFKNNGVEGSNLCHVWFPATMATGTTQKLEVFSSMCCL